MLKCIIRIDLLKEIQLENIRELDYQTIPLLIGDESLIPKLIRV